MPSNLVKSPRDEKLWKRAKEAAKKSSGEGDNWALVNHIYQQMKEAHSTADTLESMATEITANPATYYDWLVQRNFELSPTDAGSHNDWLEKSFAAEKALNLLMEQHGRGTNFPVTKYSDEEKAAITKVLELLRKRVPRGLIKVKQEDVDPLLKLLL